MKMYLWKLSHPNGGMNGDAPSGSYGAFVVVAETAPDAREIVRKHGCGAECRLHNIWITPDVRRHRRCVWSDRQKTDCTRIGLAEPKLTAGIVCSSYWSG